MPIAETSGRIRSERFVNGSSIQQIARDAGLSRNTVCKILRPEETSFVYGREVQLRPKPGRWRTEFDRLLTANTNNSALERLALILCPKNYGLWITRTVTTRSGAMRSAGPKSTPGKRRRRLSRCPLRQCKAYRYDWRHEIIAMNGVANTAKVAHMRLCHSWMFIARA